MVSILFSTITFFAVITAVIVGVVWVVLKVKKKRTRTGKVAIIALAMAVVSFIAFGLTFDHSALPSHEKSVNENSNIKQPLENSEQDSVDVISKSDIESKNTFESSSLSVSIPEPTVEASEISQTESIDAEIKPIPITLYSIKTSDIFGESNNVIGTRAYVNMDWASFENATDREIFDYLKEVFSNGYDYFNIFFDNSTVLWSWGSEKIYQIGEMPEQGFGAVEYVANDEVLGRYVWNGNINGYDHS